MSDKTPRFTDELLSAYFDDEATTDERAVVEQHLRQNPELNHQLSEYGDLREALQSLPMPAAPADLKSAVLSQLSPLPAVARYEQPSSSSGRRWVTPALVSTSLLLVVAVSVFNFKREVELNLAAGKQAGQHDAMAPAPTAGSPAAAPSFSDGDGDLVASSDSKLVDGLRGSLVPTGDAAASDSSEAIRQRISGLGRVVAPGELI
jgi:anti-sigma factor RsiW